MKKQKKATAYAKAPQRPAGQQMGREESAVQNEKDGVTIFNAVQYIDAIDYAVERDIMSIPIEEREIIIKTIRATFGIAEVSLESLLRRLKEQGEAPDMTKEHADFIKDQFQLMMNEVREIMNKKKHEK